MSQLSERVNKINEEMTDLEALNGKLADLKSMMKDIWKHQRRRVKKEHGAASVLALPGKSPPQQHHRGKTAADETKTDDEEFFEDTTLPMPDEGGDEQTAHLGTHSGE